MTGYTGTFTFKCVGCKTKKTLTQAEVERVGDLGVFCDSCHMPCVLHAVKASSRRSKRDLREVFR